MWPAHPAPSQAPSMLSIFGRMINSACCLGGWGSLPSLVVLDNNLNNTSPLSSLTSSSTVESLLDCSLLGYCPMDNEDDKGIDNGKAAVPRGPGASVPGLLARVVASPRTLPPPPLSLLSSSYANAPNYNNDLVRDGQAALQRWWGGKCSTNAAEALALLLNLTTGTDDIMNRERLL